MSNPDKLRPRATLTPEEYAKLAAELRDAYAKPPAEWPAPNLSEGVEHRELGRLPKVEHPQDNPYSKPKADLGKTLFYDARLSGSGQMACVSCHDSDLGWGDGRTVSFGHKVQSLKRNSPPILNSAFGKSFFWDGRAASLEQQAMMPIGDANEMHSSAEDVAGRLAKIEGYKPMFEKAFGSAEVTADRVAKAIACFERTIVGGNSKFDYFLNGKREALSDSAVRGLHLFRTAGRCLNCHNGPEMTDHQFHNEGLTFYGRKGEDLGRYNVTKNPEDVGKFKTPSVRNMTRSAPYMHTGSFDMGEVVNFYNGGGLDSRRRADQAEDPLFPKKSPLLQPLHLNKQDLEDLKAFLGALEEPRFRFQPPPIPE
jgi:cytochrome c peroxidase